MPSSPFPLYLLPSFPFLRRTSTTLSPSSTPSPSSSPQPTSYLSTPSPSILRCQNCLSDLTPTSAIISKSFTGRHGRAYLVAPPTYPHGSAHVPRGDLPNTLTHKPVSRHLVTGAHTVSDISCRSCGTSLGWKYVEAKEESQRYKVGKFILESERVVRGVAWDGRESGEGGKDDRRDSGVGEEGVVQFDSEDEEECEELFSGVWDAEVVGRRRERRGSGRG